MATAFEVLADPRRRQLLDLLRAGERPVGELVEQLGLSQPGVSKHLRVLREAGLLTTEKNGQQRLYALAEDLNNHLAENKNILDLGCCQFDFNKRPK